MPPNEFLTMSELAEELRTTPSTLRYWRREGAGPQWIKIGKRVIYRRTDVEAWLGEKRLEPPAPHRVEVPEARPRTDREAALARRVAYERAMRGWSMGQLVKEMERAGVAIPRSAIKRIEDCERDIKAFELAALAYVFDTTMSDLLDNTTEGK